jgi:hypothetical protein
VKRLLAELTSDNNLRQAIRQQYPNSKEKAVIRETIATNKLNLEGTVLGRLVVDSDGKVLDIKFNEGTASPELQSKARAFFNANPPKADKQGISSYPFNLQFKRNSDQQPEATSESKPETTSNSEASSQQSEATSKPKLETTPSSEAAEKAPAKDNPATTSTNSNPEPTVKPTVASNEPAAVATKSTQKLIQHLRNIREQRENSQPQP